MSTELLVERARGGDADAFSALVGPHRRALFEHCYRMLGSISDAEDVVQESLVRAWKGLPAFEARASIKNWLYRITTNACLSAIERRPRRTLPFAEQPAASADDAFLPPVLEPIWLEPLPGALSPDTIADARESVALAFVVALTKLPARQRAVLLLRDVLGFSSAEVAELLDESVAAINSALQRARESIETSKARPARADVGHDVLAGYLRAWEAADVSQLVTLLTEDARLSMPPLPQWYDGRDAIVRAIGAMVFTPGARGAMRGVVTTANGLPAIAMYKQESAGGPFLPMAIQVLHFEGDRVHEIVAFLDPSLFAAFGLPASLP